MNKGSLFIKFKTLYTRTKKILRILSEDINERKDHAIVLAWLVYIAFVVIFSKITISTLGFIGNIFTNAIGNIILDSIIGVVITIVISIRWYTKFYKKKYRITTLYLVLSQFYILFWIFIRFKMLGYGDLIAIPIFSSTCPITFLDLGFLPCLLLNVLYLDILISTKQDNTDATSSNDEITDDYPKEKIAQDHASRKAIVNDIFEKLSKADVSKHSYSVAIIGQWGIGKTTVLNFILEKNKEKAVFHVIKFSPWNFSCQANLINEFFQQLSIHIGEYDSSIPTLISKYASLLIGTEHDALSSLINDTFSSKTDVAKLFETIGKRLKSIPHKFLIVTDDMDRLDGHEIIEVFRLIRGSASFPNLLFLSAFDKGYVVDTLKNLSPSYNYRFIEKFFQAEYYISAPDVLSIEKTLKAETKLFLTEEDYCAFIEYLDQKHIFSSHRPLELFIITFRDLYRWLNALKISYNRLKGDVLIADLCDIVLLKLFFPQIYAIFSVQPQLYLLSHENKVELWSEEKSKKIAEENKHDYLFSILKGGEHKTDIRQTQEFKGLNEYDQNRILDIFERLLKKYDIPDKSFVLDFYTNRYFTNELTELEMSIEEFHDLICKEPKVIQEALLNMHPETFRAFHLHATHDFPKDNGLAMKIIKIIFAINAITDRKDFCPDSINNILNFTTLDEIKKNTFIEKCMLENGHTEYVPFFFGALKHSRCLSMYQYFTKEKQSDILHNIFKQTIESCDPEKVINFLYYNFQSRCRKPDGQEYDVYDEPACHLMKEVIKKDPENYIKRFIYKEQFGNVPKENKFMFNDFIFNIWCKDWKAFETDLMKMVEANNTPLMRELADFFNKFKAENYAPVCYDFKEGAYVYS